MLILVVEQLLLQENLHKKLLHFSKRFIFHRTREESTFIHSFGLVHSFFFFMILINARNNNNLKFAFLISRTTEKVSNDV